MTEQSLTQYEEIVEKAHEAVNPIWVQRDIEGRPLHLREVIAQAFAAIDPDDLLYLLSHSLDEPRREPAVKPTQKLSIFGRERSLIDGLAELLHAAVRISHDYGPISEERRGSKFEVRLLDHDGEQTGRIARVTVELDRVESLPPTEAGG